MNSKTLTVQGILFDLDGTLVNSAPDIGNAANNMLTTLGIEQAAPEQIEAWIGNGIPKLVKRALTKDFDGEPEDNLFKQALPISCNTMSGMCASTAICMKGSLIP